MSTIPANVLVNITPNVLPAGGNALDIIGLVLTKNTRVPIGTVASFPNALAVSDFFGATDPMATIGNVYFGGFTNADTIPGSMLVAQYPYAAVSAYVRGGNISAVSLVTLQSYSGTLSVTIDGSLKTDSISLAAATSFSNAAEIIANGLGIEGVQAASVTASITGTVMTVSAVGSGALSVGDVLVGSGITTGTYIASFGTGTGGTGTYNISNSLSVVSETVTAFTPAVQYDSVSGAFIILSGTTGNASTITFGSGSLATNLLLTQATGAVLSQGSSTTTPNAFMNSIIAQTTNWVSFMTAFDPDGGSGNTQKQAFAAWKDAQNDRYAYVCFDTDITPTESVPATTSLGYILDNNGDSGTFLVYEPTDLNMAAFVCGAAASIDFGETNGRITFAYKWQAGLTAGVTSATVASNLIANGYNFGGVYGAANQNFTWLQNGQCTGPFAWFDSYINQIWLNNQFQLALLLLLQNVKALPYDNAGYALVRQSLMDPINAGLNFGAFAPGNISSEQVAEVNIAAGANIGNALQTQGWYLQVLPASSAARALRASPPINFWYLDRGSIQQIQMASIAVQ